MNIFGNMHHKIRVYVVLLWNGTSRKTFVAYEHMEKRYSAEYLKHMGFVCISSKCLRKANNVYLYTIVTMNALFCLNKKCIYKRAIKH